MRYLLNRNGWYFYDRRVPKCFSMYDDRGRVRVALRTQCKRTAFRKVVAENDNIENYWKTLSKKKEKHCPVKFKQLMETSKQLGFGYRPVEEISELNLIELLERIFAIKKHIDNEIIVKALLGKETHTQSNVLLSQALERFWKYSKPTLMNKNPDQQRKWKNPRIKAVNNFIQQVNDKPIDEITNLDLVKFRDWWLKRMKTDGIKADTVNKDFTHLKGVLEIVATHEQINLDVDKIFKKIHIKETDRQTRKSYPTKFIRNKILNPKTLKGLDKEAQNILFVCANTGARPIEIVNLTEDDIFLDEEIPYIHIRPRLGYSLKTKESERKLPLVGLALKAFKEHPQGFCKYLSKSDKLTSTINKWLSKNNLRPTLKHSLYSLRHSFQDRLTALEIPDRIQCQLMGHKFKRPKYGDGASLEHLREIIFKINV
ncbi:tyrosine-type recombinase/integrase [Winogradskyella sp. SYSU M77433]|uniref:tyrosine-type recombinase/integrase n=1 Tax=Winogradskyella sp. SYSU M77433 TaxID=3042722 RepID=UPI002480219C|nr:tyrosine-type recombinase/integrase [Winogradskyella sp. SYSU M77433]MDH7911355.1 tyrosine-type recombinase/integrase [Winogradskyella sp. SYSU M77433]